MSQISYEMIQPLIVQAAQQGSSMHVTFRCPVSGQSIEARGHLQASSSLGGKVAESAKRSIMWSLRSSLSRAISRSLGYGIAGRVASDVAYGAVSSGGGSSTQSYSDADKQAGIIAAFESVSSKFAWDAQNRRYISAEAAGVVMTDFMQQLDKAPVHAPYDRGVAARMLTEIACADGTVSEDERHFLAGFITPDIGTVDSLAGMQRLSPAELAEASHGAPRDTMYMLAWAVALTDESLSPQEEARLGELASGLGIAAERAQQLKQFSQLYLVDQAIGRAYPNGQRDPAAHAEVMAMASRIGLDPTAAERVDIRFRKRYGLV